MRDTGDSWVSASKGDSYDTGGVSCYGCSVCWQKTWEDIGINQHVYLTAAFQILENGAASYRVNTHCRRKSQLPEKQWRCSLYRTYASPVEIESGELSWGSRRRQWSLARVITWPLSFLCSVSGILSLLPPVLVWSSWRSSILPCCDNSTVILK